MFFFHSPALRCLLVAAMLFPVFAFSQTKKGFSKLKSGKFDAACLAFSRDTANADLSAAAFYGLAQAWADEKNPAKNYRRAMVYQDKARSAWKELKTAQRTPLTKKFKVTLGSIEQLRRTTASNAWRNAEKTTDLRVIDEFIAVFPKNASYIDRKALKKQSDLLAAAANGTSGSYDELAYLYQQHAADLRNQWPHTVEPLENRLFQTFLSENGVDALPRFYAAHPQHPLAKDAGRNQFEAAWKSPALATQLQFLTDHPSSAFSPFVRQKATEVLKTNPLDETARQNLPEPQRAALAEIEWEASGKSLDVGRPFAPAQHSQWMTYIRKSAPSYGAFSATEKMYQYYAGQRDWTAASALLREGKSLFPSRGVWFDDRLAIVEGPVTGVKPVNLGPAINSTAGEYIPIITADGKHLFFCAMNREGGISGEDVFASERSDTGWTKATLVRELSDNGHEAPLSLTADGNRILQFRNGKPFRSDRTATGWSAPVPLDVDVAGFHWVGLVQIAAGDQVMFIEVMGGKSGGVDLYLSRRDAAGKWSKPVALDSLNTPQDDRSAFLHPDLRTLYFSSAGYPGLGNLDVFKTTRLDDTWLRWSRPVNLGKEINTPGQDWGYIISTDGSTAWFATQTTDNDEDIFSITVPDAVRPEAVKLVELSLKDEQGKPITDGKIVLKDAVTGEAVGTYLPNPSGETTVLTVPNDRQYVAVLEKEGYYPQSTILPKQAEKGPVNVEWNAPKLADGVTQDLKIFFDYDQAVLRPESNAELMQIARLIREGNYRVKLFGYTDDSGNEAYNLDLSKRRAEAARMALIGQGVAADRIDAEGFGEANPLVPNDTDAHRARNRRVMVQLSAH